MSKIPAHPANDHQTEKAEPGYMNIGLQEAVKDDKGKTDWSLLPVNAMEEVMKVFTHGTTSDPGRKKNQWRFGTWWSRYWNASMRHTMAWWRGHEKDEKSGLHPLAHSICSQLMLLEMVMSGKLGHYDDRENWIAANDKLIVCQTEGCIREINHRGDCVKYADDRSATCDYAGCNLPLYHQPGHD